MFFEKSSTKFGEETSLRPFTKKMKIANISGSTQPEVLYNLFLLRVQVAKYQNILKISCWPLFFTSHKAFFVKRGVKLFSLPHFLHDSWSELFLTLYSINWPDLIVWLPLLFEIFGNIMCIVIVYFPVCSIVSFLKLTLAFLTCCFPTWPKKLGQKFKYLKNEKKKAFFIIFKRAFIEELFKYG